MCVYILNDLLQGFVGVFSVFVTVGKKRVTICSVTWFWPIPFDGCTWIETLRDIYNQAFVAESRAEGDRI